MMGLVKKDFYLAAGLARSYLIVAAIFLVLSLAGIYEFSFLSSFMSLLCIMLPVNVFSYDEQAKWDKFAAALPGGRRAVVQARYVFTLIVSVGAMVLGGAVGAAACLLDPTEGETLWEMVLSTASGGSIGKIVALAKEGGYPIKEVSAEKLEEMAGPIHQGVVVTLSAVEYAEVSDILARAEEKGEKPFILIADEIEDPHNLGALIRTAEIAGAHGVIIPKRRNVGLTAAVFKTSAGAAAHLPVARVANLASAVDTLKEAGVWVYGADMEGQNWCETDFSGGVALIVGSEGSGISRLLKEKCDVMVSLPMQGEVSSINASVAGGIILYEIARQRLGIPAVNPKK